MGFDPIPLSEIEAARQRIAGTALRTPLVRLNADGLETEAYLKLENLQPIGSFKIRGASNAFGLADPGALRNGVWTASVELTPGQHHYRFIVDGDWRDDPECTVRVANPYGGQDMVKRVA